MKPSDIVGKARSDYQASDFAEMSHAKFVRDVIETILRAKRNPRAPAMFRELRQQCRRDTGSEDVPLDYLNKAFPDFPLILVAEILPSFKKAAKKPINLQNLLQAKRLEESPLVTSYLKAYAANGHRGLAMGLVFPIPYLPGGAILHNGYWESDQPGCRILVRTKQASVTLESLAAFCERITWNSNQRSV